jgi:hypothetical protein
MIFGEGIATTKIIYDKDSFGHTHHREQRSVPLPWRIFERKSGTGVPRSNSKTAKPLGIGFGDLCGHAKPCFDCLLPVKAHQGTFRCASLLPLTRLNWRAPAQCDVLPVWGGQGFKRSVAEWPLTAPNGRKTID